MCSHSVFNVHYGLWPWRWSCFVDASEEEDCCSCVIKAPLMEGEVFVRVLMLRVPTSAYLLGFDNDVRDHSSQPQTQFPFTCKVKEKKKGEGGGKKKKRSFESGTGCFRTLRVTSPWRQCLWSAQEVGSVLISILRPRRDGPVKLVHTNRVWELAKSPWILPAFSHPSP